MQRIRACGMGEEDKERAPRRVSEGKTKKKKKGLTGQTGAVAGASTWPGVQHAEAGAGRGWLSRVHQ